MIRRALPLFLALPMLALLSWGAVRWWHGEEEPRLPNGERYSLSANEVSLLQDGDIILRRGSGMVSDMIASLLNEDHDISHCGVVTEREGKFYVVHSVSSNVSEVDGMQAHPLQQFVAQSKPGSVVVTRLRTEGDRSGISRRCVQYLKRAIPFDHHFDLNDTSSFYCSELIWRVVQEEFGVDIFEGATLDKLSPYRFSNFLDPALFEVVLDHQK